MLLQWYYAYQYILCILSNLNVLIKTRVDKFKQFILKTKLLGKNQWKDFST